MYLESKGSTKRHFQVYNSIADSAGINALSGINFNGGFEVDIKTDLNNPDSYGIHSVLYDELANGGGGGVAFLGYGSDSSVNIEAANGIFTPSNLDINSYQAESPINIISKNVGIEAKSFSASSDNKVDINIVTSAGTGIKLYDDEVASSNNLNFSNANLIIEALEYGMNLSSTDNDFDIYMDNSNIDIKTSGENSIGILVDIESQYYANISVRNSDINAVSKKHGIYLKNLISITFRAENSNNTLSTTADYEAFKLDNGELVLDSDDTSHITFTNKSRLSKADLPSDKEALNILDKSKLVLTGTGIIDVIEEYESKISKSITNIAYLPYSIDKNIDDITLYEWTRDTNPLIIETDGVSVEDGSSGEYSLNALRHGGTDKISLTDNANHIIKLKADFNTFSINFDSNGGSIVESKNNAAGTLVAKPKEPTKNGFVFSHWINKANGEIWNFASDNMPSSDLNLSSVWKKVDENSGNNNGNNNGSGESNSGGAGNTATEEKDKSKYTLTYNANATKAKDDITSNLSYKAEVIVKDNMFKAPKNKVFYEWNTRADASGKVYLANDILVINEDITLYAIWKDIDEPILNKKDHISYINGYPDKSFRADKAITRAEVAMIFFNLSADKNKENTKAIAVSHDTDANAWYSQAVTYLYKNKIIDCYPDKSFRPNSAMTRAELATIAFKFDSLEVGNRTSKFTDVANTHWAFEYIVSAETKGWIKGYGDNTFKPNNSITRAELVVFINKVLSREANESSLIPGYKLFNDIDKKHYAYYPIIEASNNHLYNKNSDSKEEWQEIIK